jgi:hypothetical protein
MEPIPILYGKPWTHVLEAFFCCHSTIRGTKGPIRVQFLFDWNFCSSKATTKCKGFYFFIFLFSFLKTSYLFIYIYIYIYRKETTIIIVIKLGLAWRVDLELGWPEGWIGPGFSKDRSVQWLDQTRSTRRVNPWLGRDPTKTRCFFFLNVGFETH